jgi:hypothetical protein
MAITYTWKITGMKVQDLPNKPKAVVQTYWKKTGTDENSIEGEFTGATPFTVDPTDESGTFIAFEELTEQDVIDWVKSVVVGSYEIHVDSIIQKTINGKKFPVVEETLPWGKDTAPTSQEATETKQGIAMPSTFSPALGIELIGSGE